MALLRKSPKHPPRFHFQHTDRHARSSFNNPASFPDLTVIGRGRQWQCHRMILCKRSGYFGRMCSGAFREAGAHEHELPNDNPYALEAALQFCYTLEIQWRELAHEGEMTMAMFHVRLFNLAEYLMIEGLPELAAEAFAEAINSNELTTEQLAEAIKEAYDGSDPARLLHAAIEDRVLSDAAVLLGGETPCFEALLEEVHTFERDMRKALAKAVPEKLPENALYSCPSGKGQCHHQFSIGDAHVEENGDLTFRCPRVNTSYTKLRKGWKKFLLD